MEFQHNNPEYSVSEISGRIKRVVEDTFGYVRVRGEISKASVNSASGHCYLTLKDERAVLDAVCWKGTMGKLRHKPEAGMEVIATGKLTTYPGSSKYQLVIDALEPAGVGALMAMLEQRKKVLEAEGLFDASRKKPIPFLPQVIGVITSPTGAVIRDILHRLEDRFPRHVLLWPVAVQGEHAARQVAAAIAGFNAMKKKPDVIIVARGGGSIEDLWAFNEEIVVRAVADSSIPIISAVGHETDTTLIDYASDKRAPTPTGAAEMAVPVRAELLGLAEEQGLRMVQAMRRLLGLSGERIEALARALPRPQQLVANMSQSLDSIGERLSGALLRWLELRRERVASLAKQLSPRFVQFAIERHGAELKQLSALLESLNVMNVMKRGFALVKDAQERVVTSALAVSAGQVLSLQFADGVKAVTANGGKKPAKPTAPQAGLFDGD
jgi:exodeoxyribonuclease VII large subunit